MRAPDGRTAAGAPQGAFEESPGSTEARVPGNARRVRTQGKCNRKQTADAPARGRARLKWCGKSAPRPRQRGWHGKPHPEQDQIGATRMGWLAPAGAGLLPGRRPGRSREAPGDRRPRGMVVARSAERGTEPGLQTVWHPLPLHVRQSKPDLEHNRNNHVFHDVGQAWPGRRRPAMPILFRLVPLTPMLSHDIPSHPVPVV